MRRVKNTATNFVFLISIMFFSCYANQSKNNSEFLNQINNKRIKAIIALSIDCPICQKYQGSFLPMIKKYQDKVDFIFLFPNQNQDAAWNVFCNYDSLFLYSKKTLALDSDFQFLKKWGITTTPQLIVLDSNNKKVYSGKIDNRFESLGNEKPPSENYLEKVLTSLLENEQIKIQNTEPVGCLVQY